MLEFASELSSDSVRGQEVGQLGEGTDDIRLEKLLKLVGGYMGARYKLFSICTIKCEQ